MEDIEFVKRLLASDYRTHLPKENPYPDLEKLIALTDFNFVSGNVADERDNGSYNRDGIGYQYFPNSDKRILVHRFIVAVALKKWPPRDLDVHHLNNRPDDNRPSNLELVTRKDNNSVRRAPLKKVADLTTANKWVSTIPKTAKQAQKKREYEQQPSSFKEGSNLIPYGRWVTTTKDVLRDYYTIPEGTLWTGRRKGKNDCYWEATTGVWHYVAPK